MTRNIADIPARITPIIPAKVLQPSEAVDAVTSSVDSLVSIEYFIINLLLAEAAEYLDQQHNHYFFFS